MHRFTARIPIESTELIPKLIEDPGGSLPICSLTRGHVRPTHLMFPFLCRACRASMIARCTACQQGPHSDSISSLGSVWSPSGQCRMSICSFPSGRSTPQIMHLDIYLLVERSITIDNPLSLYLSDTFLLRNGGGTYFLVLGGIGARGA